MSRSIWKIPYFSRIFFTNIVRKGKFNNIWGRASNIPSIFFDRLVFVHNGKSLVFLEVKTSMLGHKFGEFCFTKFFYLKSVKAQKGLKKK